MSRVQFLHLAAIALATVACQSQAQTGQSQNVENALSVLKRVCVTGGSSLDLEIAADGGLMLRSAVAGVKGNVSISKKELDGFVDSASSTAARQASEMRACMKPYIDKIVEAALTGAVTTGPKTIVLKTEGTPFAVEDFDKLMGAAAVRGSDRWLIVDIKKAAPIPPAKVEHYIQIAVKNKMATFDRRNRFMHLTDSGIAYAISRGLVK